MIAISVMHHPTLAYGLGSGTLCVFYRLNDSHQRNVATLIGTVTDHRHTFVVHYSRMDTIHSEQVITKYAVED